MAAETILAASVTEAEDGTHDFQCPGIAGSPCGGEQGGFRSTGWPTRDIALARGKQHFDEHKGLGVSQSLEEFRAEHGLGVDTNGNAVKLEDI